MSLKKLRLMADMTQGDLAKMLNVDASAISNWERGVNIPRKKYRKPMAAALNITEEQLEKELE